MIIEVCLVLRIILNEHNNFSLEQISVAPCKATEEAQSNKDAIQQQVPAPTKPNHNIDSRRSSSEWVYRLAIKPNYQSHLLNNNQATTKDDALQQPLTRLAKTLSFGFDPFFDKGFFEPFERRPKPVTLVAFRKNGIMPVLKTTVSSSQSGEVAVLQSPYNDVSNFWLDDSGRPQS